MRLKIATIIILAFGIIILAVIFNAVIISNALQKSRAVNDKISNIYTPSLAFINDLYSRISDSRMLVKSWVFIDKISDTPDKLKLKKLHATDYKYVIDTLKSFSLLWADEHPEQRALLLNLDSAIVDTLFQKHQYIMEQLENFDSYDDPFIVFEVTPMTEEGGEVMILTQRILNNIEVLRRNLENRLKKEEWKWLILLTVSNPELSLWRLYLY